MILTSQFQLITTTVVDTVFQARRGRVMVTTQDPTSGFNEDDDAIEITDHTQMRGLFVVPAGLSVWARSVSSEVEVPHLAFMPFGV